MKALKPLVASFTLIAGICSASGAEVDTLTARTVARNFYLNRLSLSSQTVKKAIGQEIELRLLHLGHTVQKKSSVLNKSKQSIPPYYVFNVNKDDGFVIVPADDRMLPVLGYAFTGQFPVKEQAPALERWLENYRDQIEYMLEADLQGGEDIRRKWETFTSPPGLKGLEYMSEVLPLLTTTWNQGCYYNDLCPADTRGSCGHVVVGCVAVAMAQVMKYWEYPAAGITIPGYLEEPDLDENKAAIANTSYGCIPEIMSTVYRWSDMPDMLDRDSKKKEVSAVAEILYHAGVASHMNYGIDGSAAASWNTKNALISYFHYSPSLYFACKEDYSSEDWQFLIQEELDQGRPVYYRGGNEGAHAFVCDGYQDSDYFHFNWGWGGYGDGYFVIDELNPFTADFNEYQCAIVGVEPGESHPDPYDQIVQIDGCGPEFSQTFDGGGAGSWNLTGCYRDSPGKEQVYYFFAPDTAIYGVEVISAEGSVDYSWREADCGEPGWKCINWIEYEGRHGYLSLNGGTAYHLLLDDSDILIGKHQFYLSNLGLPELIYHGIEIDDDQVTSSGNNNGGAEPGETVELRVTLQNIGSGGTHYVHGELSTEDTLIFIKDAYEEFGDISAGEIASCGADYDLYIPPDYPVNSQIPLSLDVTSDEGNWTIPFSLHVHPAPPDPCSQEHLIGGTGPDHTLDFTGGGLGAWNPGLCGSETPGLEQLYSFTPPDTGVYEIVVVSASGSASCVWQTEACTESGWNCLSLIDSEGNFGKLKLDAGNLCYLLFDDTDTAMTELRFYVNYLGTPELEYESHLIDDQGQNSMGKPNGLAEPGERFQLMLTIQNTGSCKAHQVSAHLSVRDTTINIHKDYVEFSEIEAGESACCLSGFELSISPNCPGDLEIPLYLDLQCNEDSWNDQINLYIGLNRTSVWDHPQKDLFNIFPNPGYDLFQVNFSSPGSHVIKVESLNGNQIYEKNVYGASCRIDLAQITPGVYFITVKSGNSVATKKIIKLQR